MENTCITSLYDSEDFLKKYTYTGNDLGVSYSKEETTLKVWSPIADLVDVRLYEKGNGNNLIDTIAMERDSKGIWRATLKGDFHGIYYTYVVTVNGRACETVDIYAKAVGVNGDRGMICDLSRTNPTGFLNEKRLPFSHACDAIIYELHIRDFSSSFDSGCRYKGKYLAFTENGTKNGKGLSTCMDYLKELGITHVHLLPSYDYATVREDLPLEEQYNWGYDPKNYNVPEGSYATNPYDGAVRIREFKQMVQALHKAGIRVIMDVVYNHTYETENSSFQKTVPDYYYRKDGELFSNASDCGNELASERPMVSKYMVDSVTYWAKEYHIDGFRFDLMGVHDIKTMNAIKQAVNQIDPSIIIYGEGWTGGPSVLDSNLRAMKENMDQMPGIGAFCDDIRDALKGSVFEKMEGGFVSGKNHLTESVKFGVVAATNHPQIHYDKINYSKKPWALEPNQCINYVSAHDNLTLWDKLCTTNAQDSYELRVARNKLAVAIVYTCQGIPFIQAGEEMLRTKPLLGHPGEFDENSYRSLDETNSIKWENRGECQEVTSFYSGLIAFRKANKALHMDSADNIREKLTFLSLKEENVVAFTIKETETKKYCIIYNASSDFVTVSLKESNWDIYVNENHASVTPIHTITGNEIKVPPIACYVAVHED